MIIDALRAARALAILRGRDERASALAMEAAVRGGFRVLEFTLDTPGALALIGDFAARAELLVGAGTVLTPADAESAVRAGARFLVSPVLDAEVVAAAAELKIPLLPGTATPTEMWRAHRAGVQVVKLFPCAGGPDWLRAVLGPMPFLNVVPTQGVNVESAPLWLAAGALAVGCNRALFPADALAAGRFAEVEARARALLAAACYS